MILAIDLGLPASNVVKSSTDLHKQLCWTYTNFPVCSILWAFPPRSAHCWLSDKLDSMRINYVNETNLHVSLTFLACPVAYVNGTRSDM